MNFLFWRKLVPEQKICHDCKEKIQKWYKSNIKANTEKPDDAGSDNNPSVVILETSLDKLKLSLLLVNI